MSAIFLWLRHTGKLPPPQVKEVHKLLANQGDIKTKRIKGLWQGVISTWGDAFLEENNGTILYFDQTATGIQGDISLNDPFKSSVLDTLEGIWILLEVSFESGVVRLAQDRLAGLPLYNYQDDENFILSSEIKPIRAAMRGKCSVNIPLLAGNLLTSLPPHFDDGTLFNGVKKMKPGKIHSFNLQFNEYKSCNYAASLGPQPLWEALTHQKLKNSAQLLRSELRDSLARNLLSVSGEVALPLSGGVDSSAIAVELKKTQTPFTAFTIAYPDAPGDRSDESSSALLTANKLGIPIRLVEIESNGLLDYTDQHVYLHESPLSTLVYYVAWLMEREIKARGFKTVVTGNSAGISIGGVTSWWLGALLCSNPLLGLAECYSWRKFISLGQILSGFLTFLSRPTRKIKAFAWMHRFPRSWLTWLKVKPQLPSWLVHCDRSYSDYRLRHNLEYETHNIYMGDVRMWNYHKLKPVIPFLNLKLIEKVRSLPASFFIHKGWNKFLARYAYSEDIPSEVIWDRRKRGFESPLNRWVNEIWNKDLKEAVLSSSKMGEIVDRTRLASQFDALSPKLRWRLYTTSRFLELFK